MHRVKMHCAGEKLRVIFALIFEKEVIDTSFRSNFRRQYLKQHAFFSLSFLFAINRGEK
jgi:hypothetical protein